MKIQFVKSVGCNRMLNKGLCGIAKHSNGKIVLCRYCKKNKQIEK